MHVPQPSRHAEARARVRAADDKPKRHHTVYDDATLKKVFEKRFNDGLSVHDIHQHLGIPETTVSGMVKRMGSTDPPHRLRANKGGRPKEDWSEYFQTIVNAFKLVRFPINYRFVWTAGLRAGLPVRDETTFRRGCQKLDIYPKVVTQQSQRAVTPAMQQARRDFAVTMLSSRGGFFNHVFVDEAGFDDAEMPTKMLAVRGTKPTAFTFSKCTRRVSLIMAISLSGVVHYAFVQGGVNQEHFSAFLEGLQPYFDLMRDKIIFTKPEAVSTSEDTGDVQIEMSPLLTMDNVAFHKTALVKEIMKQKKIEWKYLPPYTPAFNPIELVFNVIRQRLRTKIATETIEGAEALQKALRLIIEDLKMYDFVNFYKHSLMFLTKASVGQDIFDEYSLSLHKHLQMVSDEIDKMKKEQKKN